MTRRESQVGKDRKERVYHVKIRSAIQVKQIGTITVEKKGPKGVSWRERGCRAFLHEGNEKSGKKEVCRDSHLTRAIKKRWLSKQDKDRKRVSREI